MSVLDSSVLIALFDSADACHGAAMSEVAQTRREHDIVVPATVLSESLVAPYRRGPSQAHEMERLVDAIGSVVDATRRIARRAAQLRAERAIELPEALVIATAQDCRASEILTFDRRRESVDERVRVISSQ